MLPVDESAAARLIETIRASVIGADQALETPFGLRRSTYADYTASGRCLDFIEDFIRYEVMPLYANTHTETSATGLQTSRFRQEAREIIRQAVGAGPRDAVIFCGSGATGAIARMIAVLGLALPADLDARHALTARIPAAERPVVFIGPYEHHSNELPWRESIADLVVIDEDADGCIDRGHLERALQRWEHRSFKIGSFSAASNVTGIESDTRAVTRLLHRYGALAFWDFAAAGPYLDVEMSPPDDPLAAKDAVFLSPHKLPGGPGTPGVLVAKRSLFRNSVPAVLGGGTVSYVNSREQLYHEDPEVREEGGTPAILGSIRAGLVFQLRQAVGGDRIREREHALTRRAIERWEANPGLVILGSHSAPRLSIVSFLVRHHEGFLHHNFVVALLNDLFGIQARGGCSCAGPYGHRLLHIDLDTSHAFESEVLIGCEGIKPGWVRVNFNYFVSEAELEFVLDAVDFVAARGWALLPLYRFDPRSGRWWHRDGSPDPPRSLGRIRYDSGRMTYPSRHVREPESALDDYLERAAGIADACEARFAAESPQALELGRDFEKLRWFTLPAEVAERLRGGAPAPPPAGGLLRL